MIKHNAALQLLLGMHRSIGLAGALLCWMSLPLYADPMSEWLNRLRATGSTPIRTQADVRKAEAEESKPWSTYLPDIKAGYGAGAKQDSTLPSPLHAKQSQWRTSVEATIFDAGVGLNKIQASKLSTRAERAKASVETLAYLHQATEAYIRAWRIRETLVVKNRAMKDAVTVYDRFKSRQASQGASALDVARVNATVLSLKSEVASLTADFAVAIASLKRYGTLPVISQPSVPANIPTDEATVVRMADSSRAVVEAMNRVLAAQSLKRAGELGRWGTVKIQANVQAKPQDTYTDSEYFVRYELPIYDKGQTASDIAVLTADLKVAYASLDEAREIATSQAREAFARWKAVDAALKSHQERAREAIARRALVLALLDDKPVAANEMTAAIGDLHQAESAVIASKAERLLSAFRLLQLLGYNDR